MSDLRGHSVIVTDGEQRAALAVVRSLGRAGASVHVVSTSGRSLAGASRFALSDTRCPDALTEPAAFATSLRDRALATRATVVIPITDAALLATLPARDSLGGALVPFPELDTVLAVADKELVLEHAARVGIAVPGQTVIGDAGQLAALDACSMRYPVVVKPARSVAGTTLRRAKFTVAHADSSDALRTVLHSLPHEAFPILVQQRVVGPGIGIFLLVWDGAVLAAFSHRRIREKPPAGGVSVYRESIALDPNLLARSVALLESLSWQGVAMVEYKVEESTGIPYLMEINGRFWGSLQLAVDAGVDFPLLLVRCALGERVAPITSYRTDVRSRWWWGDVDQLLARLRNSASTLALPPGSPGRLDSLRDFLRRDSRDSEEISGSGDFRPFVRETVQWIRSLTRKR